VDAVHGFDEVGERDGSDDGRLLWQEYETLVASTVAEAMARLGHRIEVSLPLLIRINGKNCARHILNLGSS